MPMHFFSSAVIVFARRSARAALMPAVFALAACSGSDAPPDGGSGGSRPVFFISGHHADPTLPVNAVVPGLHGRT